jgi:hypothetical protein
VGAKDGEDGFQADPCFTPSTSRRTSLSIHPPQSSSTKSPKPHNTNVDMKLHPVYADAPPELQDAMQPRTSPRSTPIFACQKLLNLALHGHKEYTWGYRIYRTTYGKPNSDADFARAIDVLNEYMRWECFTSDRGNRDPPEHDKAKNQLWQRLKNEVVQDRELLEGASPAKVLAVARDWVASIPNVTLVSTSRHRYCIVVDDEVIQHLLQLPMPAAYARTIPSVYSVKVYDLTFGVPDTYYGAPSDSDDDDEDDEQMSEEEDDGFEGWFWISARHLLHLWFIDGTEAGLDELCSGDSSWNGEARFVHWGTKQDMVPLLR